MVGMDSSESSSDEEDRRLKPIRRRDGPGFTSRTRVFDASQQPEVSALPEFFLGLNDEQDMDELLVAYQKQNNSKLSTFRGGYSEQSHPDKQVEQDLSRELISLSRKLESFSLKVKQIPPQSSAAKNLHIGLQLVKEYLSTAAGNTNFTNNIHPNEVYGYTDSLQNTEPYDEWFSPIGTKEQFTVESETPMKKFPEICNVPSKKNASCQTNISGEVIPREASAALEFFQELIKNS